LEPRKPLASANVPFRESFVPGRTSSRSFTGFFLDIEKRIACFFGDFLGDFCALFLQIQIRISGSVSPLCHAVHA
jgi:hypothetical protein